MLLKKETRFVFLLMSFLGKIHQSLTHQTSFFSELVESALRFKNWMCNGV